MSVGAAPWKTKLNPEEADYVILCINNCIKHDIDTSMNLNLNESDKINIIVSK